MTKKEVFVPTGRLDEVLEIEKSDRLQKLGFFVRAFLSENPPTLGHGHSHLKETARRCLQIALDTGYENPEIAYAVGFLHDIYRPAEGKGGKEEHEEVSAGIARRLLIDLFTDEERTKIADTIKDHEQNIQEGKPTVLDQILSIADKVDMSYRRGLSYCWASNQSSSTEQRRYLSPEVVLSDFSVYQVKARSVFAAVRRRPLIKGMRKWITMAKSSYDTTLASIQTLLDKSEEQLLEEIERIARLEAQLEKECLREAGATEAEISKITANFGELL